MVVKIYISGISGNKEVKKRQQRVLMILDSKNINYEIIDITEPGREADKDFMQNNSKSNGGTVSDPNPRSPLPPQVFNEEEYCGDYDQFDLANECDILEQFLKLELPPEEPEQVENEKEATVNGDAEEDKEKTSKENSQERESADANETEEKEGSPAKEGTPAKEATPLREPTPVDEAAAKEPSPDKEENVEAKESSPERQKSVEKEKSPIKESEPNKESSPEKDNVNENGTVSSREQSEEKEAAVEVTENVESKKENLSEALIESEKAAAAE